ncbi:MAG: type II toxin-antitoxin system PemK/MazF family toxin [Verrucomicrobia bacterium]|nr:type II toxin-antitoxin system PemK/MazF family toxin [Verrucomicrobiota bacterium]
MKRGTVFWVNLEDVHPPEFGKVRPGIVVSNTVQNEILDTVVVIPLSTKPGEIWPLRLKLALPGQRPSFAIVPGIRQVNKSRILDELGVAGRDFLSRLDLAVAAYLTDI